MNRRRHGVVELEQGAGPFERSRVEQAWVVRKLRACLRAECAQKVSRVYASEPSFDETSAAFEVEGYGDGGCRTHLFREICSTLSKPLEEDVASEREARQCEWLAPVLVDEPPYDAIQIRGLTGVIEPTRTRHLPVARSENQRIDCPAATLCECEQPAQIMRADRALQAVEHE